MLYNKIEKGICHSFPNHYLVALLKSKVNLMLHQTHCGRNGGTLQI